MKQKKAAMELSVTAIVTLILAIVMLGLGLGFIRGMFTKVSTSFEEQIGAEPEPIYASSSDPLTVSRESIITEAGAQIALKVSAHNPSSEKFTQVVPDMRCKDKEGTGTESVTAAGTKRDIEQGDTESFTVLVTIPNLDKATYLCEIVLTTTPFPPAAAIVAANDKLFKDITLKIQ